MSRHVIVAPANEMAMGRKIMRLGERLSPPQPIGQRGEDEPDAHSDQREQTRSSRRCCGSTRSMLSSVKTKL